ncbi:hypothetical protein IMCC3317_16310 [Kordia antarctica]|uniref:Uncharacterized protein n=1 Tax=Kordia antarctica TaxID=1218801 RepID=A0A7L4ZIE4_9FLAO|nr:hypothetical protein IMCC3317_16310 [Kordia antarctica]
MCIGLFFKLISLYIIYFRQAKRLGFTTAALLFLILYIIKMTQEKLLFLKGFIIGFLCAIAGIIAFVMIALFVMER